MAVPKRRQSRHRSGNRSHHLKLTPAQLVPCKKCSAKILPHHVCWSCGWYRDKRQMIVIETS